MWLCVAKRIERMKFAGQVKEIKGNSVRFVGRRSGLHDPRVERNLPHQGEFRGVRQLLQRGGFNQTLNIVRQVGKRRSRVAEDRLATGVAVLDVEYRVVARLLDHLSEVEVERGFVLTKQ